MKPFLAFSVWNAHYESSYQKRQSQISPKDKIVLYFSHPYKEHSHRPSEHQFYPHNLQQLTNLIHLLRHLNYQDLPDSCLPSRPNSINFKYPPGCSSSPTILSGSLKSLSITCTFRPSCNKQHRARSLAAITAPRVHATKAQTEFERMKYKTAHWLWCFLWLIDGKLKQKRSYKSMRSWKVFAISLLSRS